MIATQNQDHAEGNNKTLNNNNNNNNSIHDDNNINKGPHNPRGSRHQNNSNNNKRRRGRAKQSTSVKALTPVEGCSVCKVVQEDAEPPKYKCPKCRASYCSVVCCRQHKTVCPGKDGGGPTTATTMTTTISGVTTVAAAAAASSSNGTIVNSNNNNTINRGNDDDDSDSEDDDDDSSLEEGFKITDDMKNALRKSTWLRNELQDGGLRDMISSVVRSGKKFKKSQNNNNNNNRNRNHKFSNNNRKQQQQQQQHCPHPHDDLAAKRQDNQNFDIFVDKLLVLGDVLERRQGEIIIREDGNGSSSGVGGGGIKGTDIPPRRNEEELEEWLKRKWDHGDPPQDLTLKPRPRKLKVIPKFEPVDVSSSEEEDEDEDMDEDDGNDNKSDNDDDEEKSSSECDDSE
jgi:hypothetical protein